MNRPAVIADQNVFSLAHPEFYESLAYLPLSSEYVEWLKDALPETWTLHRTEIWVHALCEANPSSTATTLIQGFKIHVSCTPACALRVLTLVVPLCVQAGINFKIAGDLTLLHLLNSKQQGRGSSGKFMTIYPPHDESFKELIERLYQQTKDDPLEGPYILSDRRYKESKILFYRYGGFYPLQKLNIDGTQSSFLISPTGEYIPDQRLPYFHLPDWVDDPFGGTPAVAYEGDDLLNGRYRVEGALGFSNAGGVYYGVDTTTEKPVIIKEARPFTNCWSVGERIWDAVYLLQREYEMLRRLEELEFVPTPVELFQDWEHTFLVEERVDGITLDAYWAQEQVILAPYIRRAGRIEQFVPKYKQVAEVLIRMVAAFHERGVLLGDLSPRNILINAETLQMWFIDFESATLVDDRAEMLAYASEWGTAGFMHPGRASRSQLLPQDDLYAVAMILYSAVVPANYFFNLNPAAAAIFLDKFIALGLPAEVKAVIESLLRGDAQEAQGILARWKV
ncbi:MAG: hypothetical protein IT328_12290 [Caldilineaceae bacterium]|nr:hypothetical protein [Caldilineaceae bacterium]